MTGGIVLLFVFSLFSIGGTIEIAANNVDAASLFTPFVADTAITSIEDHSNTAVPMSQKHLSLLLFFHRKNPEILQQLAKYYVAQRSALTFQFYEKTIITDPQNTQIYKEYIEEAVKESNLTALADALKEISVLRLPPPHLYQRFHRLFFLTPQCYPLLKWVCLPTRTSCCLPISFYQNYIIF